jgi:hypothetical protein
MAKKISKTKQKQKQRQSQNVKQTVIIRLDKDGKRKIKRRKRTSKKEPSDGVSLMQSFPPPVIYQSYAQPPIPATNLPLEPAPTIKNISSIPVPIAEPVPTSKKVFEDVGVGTEGFVKILEPAEPEFVDLVPPLREKPLALAEDDFYSKKIKEFRSMREPMIDWNLPEPIKPVVRRRNKKEMEESRQMEREDVASINLGLSQFDPLLQSKGIHEGLPKTQESKPSEPSEESIPAAFKPTFISPKIDENLPRQKPINLAGKEIESLMTGPSIEQEQNIPDMPEIKQKKMKSNQTWKYWRDQYRQMTGQDISLKEAKQKGSLDDFIEFVKRIK